MKLLADELKRLSRRDKLILYYELLTSDLKEEAYMGGNHKVINIGSENYNAVCKRLLKDGFEVIINNYNHENPSYMVFIVWDKEKFEEALKENTDIDKTKFHYGLI